MQLQGVEPGLEMVFESWREAQHPNPIPLLEMRKHKPREIKWLTLKSHWHEILAELRLEPRGLNPALSDFHSLSEVTLKIHHRPSHC